MEDKWQYFIKSVNVIFPGAHITWNSSMDTMNGGTYHSLRITAKLPINYYTRIQAFDAALRNLLTATVKDKTLNILGPCADITYNIATGLDMDYFLEEFTHKVTWSMFSVDFDIAVEEELSKP